MRAELEAKFLADGPEPLAALAAEERLGDAILGAPRTVDEVDRYLDTADGRLAAAHWACRLRDRGGDIRISLKGPMRLRHGDSLHERPELEGPASASTDPSKWPPSEARSFLDELRSGKPLVERFRLAQRRTERTVRLRGSPPLATLSLDDVTIEDGRGVRGRLRVVELELRADDGERDASLLAELAREVAARPGLTPDAYSKLEHALERLGYA